MIFTKYFEKRKKEKQRIIKIKTAKKILTGTAAGSLGGLLGGLLFSPKSGKENRKDVKEKATEIKGAIDNKVSDTKDNVIDAKVKIKQKSEQLKEKLDNKVSDAKGNVIDAKAKISDYINEKKSSKNNEETIDVVSVTDTEDVIDIVGQADLVEKKAKK